MAQNVQVWIKLNTYGSSLRNPGLVGDGVVLLGQHCTGMYTSIETSMFRTGLNTCHTGHVPNVPAGTKKRLLFFIFLVL